MISNPPPKINISIHPYLFSLISFPHSRTPILWKHILRACPLPGMHKVRFAICPPSGRTRTGTDIMFASIIPYSFCFCTEKVRKSRKTSNSSALRYSASKIALYAILRVVKAPKCDFGAFCVHLAWQWSRRLNCYIFLSFSTYPIKQTVAALSNQYF